MTDYGDIADQIGTRGPSEADRDRATTTDPDPTQPRDRDDDGGTATDRARSRSSSSSPSEPETQTIGATATVERAAQLDHSDFDFTDARSGAFATVERAAQIQDADFTPTGISGARTVERAAQIDQQGVDFTGDDLGTIADARIPGTDTTVIEGVDRADRAFRDRVVDPAAAVGRRAGEMDIPVGPAGGIEGSERRGQLGEDFGRSAAQALNVPGFAAGVLRAAPRVARAEGEPDAARRAATAGRQLGGEAATFARENPLRTAAMGGGFLAGAGAVTGAARATRAGARRARETDLDLELGAFRTDQRAQLDGRTRTRDTDTPTAGEDTVTIGADDLSPIGARADPLRGGRFGTEPTGGRAPQDPGVGPSTTPEPAGGGAGLGFRTAQTERGTARVVPDPLDTAGGATPTGQSLGGLLGFSDAAAASFAGLTIGAQLGRQQQAETPSIAEAFDPSREIVGTGAAGTGVDMTPEFGTGTDTDPLVDTGTDDGTAAMTGIGARTGPGTRTATDTALDTPQLQTPTLRDLTTTGAPTQPTTRPPGRPPGPRRVPTPRPELDDGDDEELEAVFDADDELFDTGILDADEAFEQAGSDFESEFRI